MSDKPHENSEGTVLAVSTMAALIGEVRRARSKFPGNEHLTVALGEELGELTDELYPHLVSAYGRLCKAQLQRNPDAIRAEALQVACVAIRIYEEGDASLSNLTDEQSLGVNT